MCGYSDKKLSVAVEYNNQINSKYRKDYNYSGYSICGTYDFNTKFGLVGRYDIVESSSPTSKSWNFSNDGQQCVLGIEYKPVKGIRISPNSQIWAGRNVVNIYLYSLNLELKM